MLWVSLTVSLIFLLHIPSWIKILKLKNNFMQSWINSYSNILPYKFIISLCLIKIETNDWSHHNPRVCVLMCRSSSLQSRFPVPAGWWASWWCWPRWLLNLCHKIDQVAFPLFECIHCQLVYHSVNIVVFN